MATSRESQFVLCGECHDCDFVMLGIPTDKQTSQRSVIRKAQRTTRFLNGVAALLLVSCLASNLCFPQTQKSSLKQAAEPSFGSDPARCKKAIALWRSVNGDEPSGAPRNKCSDPAGQTGGAFLEVSTQVEHLDMDMSETWAASVDHLLPFANKCSDSPGGVVRVHQPENESETRGPS